jgi:hypothetical protein
MCCNDFFKEEMKEDALIDLVNSCKNYLKNNKNRRMSLKELDSICKI